MNKKEMIANAIFPDIKKSVLDLEIEFPKRNLKEGAIVTRFAPSPTGFLHTGSLFTSLVSWRFAKQTEGVFFLRLEDTDQKREIKGSGDKVIEQLKTFGIEPDESYLEESMYGPLIQSERKEIYHTVIKEMIISGDAYPCFCSHDDLADIRRYQEDNKLLPGYYGEFATCRHLNDDEVLDRIKKGDDFVIRFKSNGQADQRVSFDDAIRGTIEFPENILDIVIMKTDQLPTYHFAHVVDDHFMRTTHVTRGEEWMSSAPIHLEIFDRLNWTRPIYAHFPVIMKLDDGKRRKLSKRKDEEASVDYFLEKGYPIEGFLEYLMTLANSNFEEWRIENPQANIFDFDLSFNKMSLDGALFDIEKIKSISKDRLSLMNAHDFTDNALAYARQYEPKLEEMIEIDRQYFEDIINIGRDQEKPRKDYEKYADVYDIVAFMYDKNFYDMIEELPFNERFSKDLIKEILDEYIEDTGLNLDQNEWFSALKDKAVKRNFAPRPKDYKKNPDQYIGHVGDYAEIVRIAACGKPDTPNFYDVLKILGQKRVVERISYTINLL
ncbi:MAG: glutamate--tRNA ligase [Candidatus Izemoplasmatales bacterium]|uniref:Glutamate--tRNA ligase n=1 Tax=Hujiaoplasma nucleasis TaxID=2725268 RepID=A0A7L6N3T5_9MOLU|nr:glutamate--tRNA ligase [Hujiaoplasma nucleasis]QLY40211.1 glutamate--tRNA ligase [Hujiaoplasma nucleasis]